MQRGINSFFYAPFISVKELSYFSILFLLQHELPLLPDPDVLVIITNNTPGMLRNRLKPTGHYSVMSLQSNTLCNNLPIELLSSRPSTAWIINRSHFWLFFARQLWGLFFFPLKHSVWLRFKIVYCTASTIDWLQEKLVVGLPERTAEDNGVWMRWKSQDDMRQFSGKQGGCQKSIFFFFFLS